MFAPGRAPDIVVTDLVMPHMNGIGKPIDRQPFIDVLQPVF